MQKANPAKADDCGLLREHGLHGLFLQIGRIAVFVQDAFHHHLDPDAGEVRQGQKRKSGHDNKSGLFLSRHHLYAKKNAFSLYDPRSRSSPFADSAKKAFRLSTLAKSPTPREATKGKPQNRGGVVSSPSHQIKNSSSPYSVPLSGTTKGKLRKSKIENQNSKTPPSKPSWPS